MVTERNGVAWILMSYRVPRLPSAPRIVVWRRLRRLGVAQLGDGLVALPEGSRTREQLEWAADEVVSAAGQATLWRAQTLSAVEEQRIARAMAAARAQEYVTLIGQAQAALDAENLTAVREVRRLRRELHRVRRRDYFPPVERERAVAAIDVLAKRCGGHRTAESNRSP